MEKYKVDKKCRQVLEDLRYAIESNENVEIAKNVAEKFISLNNPYVTALDYDTYEVYNNKLNELLLSIQFEENSSEINNEHILILDNLQIWFTDYSYNAEKGKTEIYNDDILISIINGEIYCKGCLFKSRAFAIK